MSQTNHRTSRLTRQMLEDELDRARIHRVNVTEDMLTLYLEDGRVLGMPTVWSPRLSQASEAERQNYEIIGHGAGLHWPDLDEYVSVRSILLGRRSAEHTSESEGGDH
ncbi:MAG: DUF2442 domain-containing protein [Salinibacter sp.]|uniref:DUF2442 domain-containing protein n=1 Tax=Salinibacter sp. TaxID=2065818 RepID=UPI0035D4D067